MLLADLLKFLMCDVLILIINFILAITYIKLKYPELTEFEDEDVVDKFLIISIMPLINLFMTVYMFYNIISVIRRKIGR